MIKLENSKINEIQENIINWYDDIMTQDELDNEYFIVSLRDDIERCIVDEVDDQVLNSLKNDIDYIDEEDEDEKESYLDENKFDRFIELTTDLRSEMYNNIVKHFESLGFDCYEGGFFPCNGQFKNLNDGEIAFIK